MTREECEEAIHEKVREIKDIYLAWRGEEASMLSCTIMRNDVNSEVDYNWYTSIINDAHGADKEARIDAYWWDDERPSDWFAKREQEGKTPWRKQTC